MHSAFKKHTKQSKMTGYEDPRTKTDWIQNGGMLYVLSVIRLTVPSDDSIIVLVC